MDEYTFIYIDYGVSEHIHLELRYSLSTLLDQDLSSNLDVVVYTDKPDIYADLPVRTVDIKSKIQEFSRGGSYYHRIKPCVLLEELRANSRISVLLDTDTFVRAGFIEGLSSVLDSRSAAMDVYYGLDPYPGIGGFTAVLPHAGPYIYDPAESVGYNSGLVAVNPGQIPAVEDSIALIDALLDDKRFLFTIEQIAVSECFRVHGVQIKTMRPLFQHYYRKSQKRYMHWHIRRLQDQRGAAFKPGPAVILYTQNRVRFFHHWRKIDSVIGKLQGA